MSLTLLRPGTLDGLAPLEGACRRILEVQQPDGAIPWFEHGPWDAWNHAECVMALGVMGEHEAAERGLQHLAQAQAPDGGWLGAYGNALPMDGRLKLARVAAPTFQDSNFIAYPAVAVWHLYRLRRDLAPVRRYWPMVRAAIDFVLRLQHPTGDISWSKEGFGGPEDDALVAGGASIFKSLGCAIQLAGVVEDPQPHWRVAQRRLQRALLEKPERFDRAGKDRSGFAMDWYYPVLGGVLSGPAAVARLDRGAETFVEPGRGCRCVASEPWATVAESCELAMALVALGARRRAERLIDWQSGCRDADGVYWMGWQFQENIVWPEEKPSWTQAAAILAADALHRASPAADVLTSSER